MLYLKNDVLLLTDTFQVFIVLGKSAFGICFLWSYGTTSFTWKVGFKMTGLELDYIKDDKISFSLENSRRGGTSSVLCNRHVKQREKIAYGIIDNLYGWSMSKCLPTRNFHEIVCSKRDDGTKIFGSDTTNEV